MQISGKNPFIQSSYFSCSFFNCSIFIPSSPFWILWYSINVAYCTICFSRHVPVYINNPTYDVVIRSWNISFKFFPVFFQVLSFLLSWCFPMLSKTVSGNFNFPVIFFCLNWHFALIVSVSLPIVSHLRAKSLHVLLNCRAHFMVFPK